MKKYLSILFLIIFIIFVSLFFTRQKSTDSTVKIKETSGDLITSNDLLPYLSGVIEITCHGKENSSGSGSLWNIDNYGYAVLTNKHVISTNNCDLIVADSLEDSTHSGIYDLDPQYITWNKNTDVAVLKITDSIVQGSIEKTLLNYKISTLRKCPSVMPLNSPVTLVGFPASTFSQDDLGLRSSKTVTNGIISAHYKMSENLKYTNYYVSAKIDSGNSGGVAFSKDNDGLCLLGLPTWISVGNYDTQGVIQNIWNVLDLN